MMFPWSKSRQRQALLTAPFPGNWRRILRANIALYRRLPTDTQRKLEDGTRIIVAEKNWEGVQGLTLTDQIKVTIAGMASLLVLGFDDDYYPNLETILVYPGSFLIKTVRNETPVIVSWADIRAGIASGGQNVVLHEFAHKLDMRDGSADGAPYLENATQIETWSRVMSAEYQRLVAETQAGERGVLNPYGATNAAEFFAVATESFFENAPALWELHSELYALLRDFYHQDPAALLRG